MKIIQLPLAVLVALSVGPAFAQATKPAPAASASAAKDCEKRHDHRADKGNPVPASARCPDAAPKGQSAASKPHDHGKMHKQQ